MFYPRRRRDEPKSLTYAKVAAFFLAAGLWIGGVATGSDRITGVALAILVIALAASVVLRLVHPRRGRAGDGERELGEDESSDQP